MSFIVDATAECPTCRATARLDFPASINADRRPDLRAAILDGSIYGQDCASCGERLSFEPQTTYLDVGRRQWILAQSSEDRSGWLEAEQTAIAVHATAFGRDAPAAARRLGESVVSRLVFGWPAMAEKLLCRELGLDDIALEALKMTAIAHNTVPVLDPGLDFRLVGDQDEALLFAWLDPADGDHAARMQIPKAAYALLKGGGDAWTPLMERVTGSPFVDIGRVLRASPAPAA
jgi:CpXC protein